jgi:hypothetical protein
MKIRIYPGSDAQKSGKAVATLVFGRERAGSLAPARVDPATRFYLESVDSQDNDLRDRPIEALSRESVPVVRAAATSVPIRTRGSYPSTEPYGTATYWRAAIGLPASELGVSYDIGDYTRALQSMETAETTPAVAPARELAAEAPPPEPPTFSETLDSLLTQLGLGRRPRLVTRGGPPRSAAPPIDPEPLQRRLREDPEFLRAVFQLHQALNHPQLRLLLPAALEAFAREAASHEAKPG